MKMTAAQVVETLVTANITWDLNSAAGEKRRGKNGLAVQSARFALGLFLAVSLLRRLVPGQCQQQSRTTLTRTIIMK